MVGLFDPARRPGRWAACPRTSPSAPSNPNWGTAGAVPAHHDGARAGHTLDAGIRTFFCGPESFTPDLLPQVGEALASVATSSARASTRSAFSPVAAWVALSRNGSRPVTPTADVTAFNVDRFQAWRLAPRLRAARTSEVLGTVYAAHAPGTQLRSGRGIKRSPLRDKLIAGAPTSRMSPVGNRPIGMPPPAPPRPPSNVGTTSLVRSLARRA